MLENVSPPDAGFLWPNRSSLDSRVMAGFVDLGMQMGVVADGMGVCEISGLVVCSVFEDNAADFEREQLYLSSGPGLALAFWCSMAHFDTSVARKAVSVHRFSGSRLFVQICLC